MKNKVYCINVFKTMKKTYILTICRDIKTMGCVKETTLFWMTMEDVSNNDIWREKRRKSITKIDVGRMLQWEGKYMQRSWGWSRFGLFEKQQSNHLITLGGRGENDRRNSVREEAPTALGLLDHGRECRF